MATTLPKRGGSNSSSWPKWPKRCLVGDTERMKCKQIEQHEWTRKQEPKEVRRTEDGMRR